MARKKAATTAVGIESAFWPIDKMPLCIDPNDPLEVSGAANGWDLASYDANPLQQDTLLLLEVALQRGDFALVLKAQEVVYLAKAHRTNWWRRRHGETVTRTIRRVYGTKYGCHHGKGVVVESHVGDSFTDTFTSDVWGDLALILDGWDQQGKKHSTDGDYGVMAVLIEMALERTGKRHKSTKVAIAYPWNYRALVLAALRFRMDVLEQLRQEDRDRTAVANGRPTGKAIGRRSR